jgi:AbrB family looped-hinge helix DNA binding protein
MATLTVAPDGNLNIPKEVVESIGIKPGDDVLLETLSDGSAILKPSNAHSVGKRKGRIEDLAGLLAGKTNVKLTIEEINEGIIQGCIDEYEAGLNGRKLSSTPIFSFASQSATTSNRPG